MITFTIPGRVTGKIRWGSQRKKGQHIWGTRTEDERARAYIDQCNRIRQLAWEGRADTAPLPPYLLGVAAFINPSKGKAAIDGYPAGGRADWDNLCGAIVDALQGCLLCQKKAKGKGRCRCARPRILLLDDSPAHYRGMTTVVHTPIGRLRPRFYLTDGPEVVYVEFARDSHGRKPRPIGRTKGAA